MGIGTTLKELLKERGMTAKKLAEETGISINTIYSVLKRDNDSIKPDALFKIARVLNVSPDSILDHAKEHSKEPVKLNVYHGASEAFARNHDLLEKEKTDPSSRSREMQKLLESSNFSIEKVLSDNEDGEEKFVVSDLKRGVKITVTGEELLEIYRNLQDVFEKLLNSTMIDAINKRFSDPAPTDTTEQSATATDTD